MNLFHRHEYSSHYEKDMFVYFLDGWALRKIQFVHGNLFYRFSTNKRRNGYTLPRLKEREVSSVSSIRVNLFMNFPTETLHFVLWRTSSSMWNM